ncbi:MAG: lytic transglycosylase domain-containing protein [Candidatus Thiosymbion ectosymbiont of Robbea hypermnestra]|nr:lytic transglycosylase domain-containing protein [Candidatus Thiosymbion ectosymbiont of Robbea hypermnestra]
MKRILFGSILLLLIGISLPCSGDLYKYLDADGRLYFTDTPLMGDNFQLEWKRASKELVEKSNKIPVLSGRHKLAVLPKQLSARRARYVPLIKRFAKRFKLRPELIHAVIRAESGYDPMAISPAGAVGLMQLIPTTAAKYKVSDLHNPAENIRGGANHLRFLLDKFKQNLRLALAGYNAGEHAVIKYGNQIPPYPETQQYVRKVLQFLWAEHLALTR